MTAKVQKLSIRLLKDGLEPKDGLRDGIALKDWQRPEDSKIAFDTIGGGKPPKWSDFLELDSQEKDKLKNSSSMGLLFVQAEERWFAISFGLGHVKLNPDNFEQNFGLRVALNSVDPKRMRSADVRTPDENTLSKRSQTSRGSDQTAFSIDPERDIVRGVAGIPKDEKFASHVSGADSLTISRKMTIQDLPQVCSEVYTVYQKDDYKQYFDWIDKIKSIRDKKLIGELTDKVVGILDNSLKGSVSDNVHLAFPEIYDPNNTARLKYGKFRSKNTYADLDLAGYIDALKAQSIKTYKKEYFEQHKVYEVDDQGNDIGRQWKLSRCVACEVKHDGRTYVLCAGLWYQIDGSLAKEVSDFFQGIPTYNLPDADKDENEADYNVRVAEKEGLLCLDRKLVHPSDASSPIEICDLLSKEKHLIHVKNKAYASRLSHLFNQGMVSGLALIDDSSTRYQFINKINNVQKSNGKSGFDDVVNSMKEFKPQDWTVVYAVIGVGNEPSFFSLITLRQAVKYLRRLGYDCKFCQIKRPAATGSNKQNKRSK